MNLMKMRPSYNVLVFDSIHVCPEFIGSSPECLFNVVEHEVVIVIGLTGVPVGSGFSGLKGFSLR
jgi:hypothetical protein